MTRAQLLDHGLTPKMIAVRLAGGRLLRHAPGVYLVGHAALSGDGRRLAAVRAHGPRAVLSHRSASAAWGLQPPAGGPIHVSTPVRTGRRADRGVRLHHPRWLPPEETTVRDAIPVTTLARTIVDLAATVHGRRMEDVIAQADRLALFDLVELRRVLTAHPTRTGAPALTALLDRLAGGGPADLRSTAEVALLELCDRAGLPSPRTNVVLQGFTVDAHWPGTTLIVEVDGFQFHRMPSAFERDRDRDQVLTLAGYVVLRFTSRQLTRAPRRCAERLGTALVRCGASGGP